MVGFVIAPSRAALPSEVTKRFDPQCEPFEENAFCKRFLRVVSAPSSVCFMRSYISTSPPLYGSMTLCFKPAATFVVSFDTSVFAGHSTLGEQPASLPPEGIVGLVHTLKWEKNAVWGCSTEQWEPEGVEFFHEQEHGPQMQFYGRMCPDPCLPLKFSGFSFVC